MVGFAPVIVTVAGVTLGAEAVTVVVPDPAIRKLTLVEVTPCGTVTVVLATTDVLLEVNVTVSEPLAVVAAGTVSVLTTFEPTMAPVFVIENPRDP